MEFESFKNKIKSLFLDLEEFKLDTIKKIRKACFVAQSKLNKQDKWVRIKKRRKNWFLEMFKVKRNPEIVSLRTRDFSSKCFDKIKENLMDFENTKHE
ncbi:MAG: hypothetical protein ABEJ24_00510 [Candidatus Magasanikbacteria bacterium]